MGIPVSAKESTALPLATSARPAAPIASEERAWVARIRVGDAAAFEQMFHAYAGRLTTFVYRYVHSPDAAQEIVQDLFLAVWSRRTDWEVTTTLSTFLYTAARNRALDHLRRERIEERFRGGEDGHERGAELVARTGRADDGANAEDLGLALREAVGQLSPRSREVFLLAREHGLTYAQIAAVLRIAPKTVEIHMGRALGALRERLRDWVARPFGETRTRR